MNAMVILAIGIFVFLAMVELIMIWLLIVMLGGGARIIHCIIVLIIVIALLVALFTVPFNIILQYAPPL